MENILALKGFLIRVEFILYWAALALYGLSALLYLLNLLGHVPYCTNKLLQRLRFLPGKAAVLVLLLAAIVQVLMLGLRSFLAGRPPLANKYECFPFYTVLVVIVFLISRRRWRTVHFSGLIVALFACAMLYIAAVMYSPQIRPLHAALDSQWYAWHIAFSYVAYAALTVSFAIEATFCLAWVLYKLHLFRPATGQVLTNHHFHRDAYRLVMFGFPMLTFMLLSGAAWANEAWGGYWHWDPIEVSSLLMWLIYALYLHAMRMKRWRTVVASALNVLGFAAIMVTLIGIHFLPKIFQVESLHSY